MTVHVAVLYPNEPDSTFDLDYYMAHHMPLVSKIWGPAGLKDYHVVQYGPGPDGAKPPYSVGCTLVWENEQDLKAAMTGEGAKEIMDDVTKFSNKHPIFLAGPVVEKK